MGNYNRDDRSGPRRDSGRRDFGNRGFGGGGGRSGPREMHKAICDKCGKECEVPFMPTGGKPVFCSDCFERKNKDGGSSQPSRDFQDRGPRRPSFEGRDEVRSQRNDQLEAISHKLDKILELLSTRPVVAEEKAVEIKPAKEEKTEKKKEKAPKKKVSAKDQKPSTKKSK